MTDLDRIVAKKVLTPRLIVTFITLLAIGLSYLLFGSTILIGVAIAFTSAQAYHYVSYDRFFDPRFSKSPKIAALRNLSEHDEIMREVSVKLVREIAEEYAKKNSP
jgi:uncharacterized membrane protein